MMPLWRQVSEYVDPSRGRFSEGDDRKRAIRRSRNRVINGWATYVARIAAAGLTSHSTSKARPWFRLAASDPRLNESFDVRVWLDEVSQIVRDTLAASNFYKAMPVVNLETVLYGVCPMLVLESPSEVIRFYPLTIGSYAVGLDDEGRVDTLWRCYPKTARQLEQRYGRDRLPRMVLDALDNGRVDSTFTVESLAERNPEAAPGIGPMRLQAADKRPFREIVWIQGGDSDPHGVLDIGGHYEPMFVCSRWNPVADDVYSCSPGIDALGDIKQLQYQEGKKLKLADLLSEPPLGVPDSLKTSGGNASLAAGAINYLPSNAVGARAEPLYVPLPAAYTALTQDIEEIKRRINAFFYYDLFLMLAAMDDRERTATEIAERKEEKSIVLSPTLEAQTDEIYDPVVLRTFRLLERAGRLPEPPEALAGSPVKIEYTSILAQAQRAVGSAEIERVVAFAGQAAQFDQNVLDKIDFDQALDEYNASRGGPASIVRSDDDVKAMRDARQQQQAMAQAAAMAKPAADFASAAKTMGEAQQGNEAMGQ